MTTQRVADKEFARSGAEAHGKSSRLSRLSAAIASPSGVLAIVPSLVAAVALLLTWVAQVALRESNLSMARGRLDEETTLVAHGIRMALGQADPMLDRLRDLSLEHDANAPVPPIAHALYDIINGRAGIAYVSISFSDGTFLGAYTDQGKTRFQDSRITASGTRVVRYELTGHRALTQLSEEHSAYDPRQRDFYRLASESGRRVWTKPYPFYRTHYTGITRAEPVFSKNADGSNRLHAVLTVDFDVSTLSDILKRVSLDGATTLLFSSDGTLLAYPKAADSIAKLPLPESRPLHHSDLRDPLLDAFFARTREPDASDFALTANDATWLVAQKAISKDPGIPWTLAALVPEERVLSPLYAHQKRSLAAALLATLAATVIAWLFARHILRSRNELHEARAQAAEALARARDLGSYRLVEQLGKGGMGEVWRAEHRLLVRQAAIKLIRIDDANVDRRQMEERFRREAQSLATLNSRNTIELFDYGVTPDGTFFYVMELLDGMDLESLVDRYGPQPPARVVNLLVQACQSLAEAHDAGLVHRDIKPANLYVCRVADEVDVVKVLDFGLVRQALHEASPASLSARELSRDRDASEPLSSDVRLTQMGQAMGTPAYMAPEQALGYETDGRADIYALGCVAFWLLSGQLVFDRAESMPLMMAHITETPPALPPLCRFPTPPELCALVLRCLAKKPEERPASARELAKELRAIPLGETDRWTLERAESWWRDHHRPRGNASDVLAGADRGAPTELAKIA